MNNFNEFYIGNVLIKNPVVVAPMAGVTNHAFRSILKIFEPGLIYTEMVSDKAIFYRNKKTLNMLNVYKEEKPISLQIFGSDLKTFKEAAIFIDENSNCDIIDINMGCPVPKITKNEAGAKLLLDSNKIYNIVYNVIKSVKKPVTVKMRLGWDKKNINVVENAIAIEKAGAKAIAIHARTAMDKYTPGTNWGYIKDVKRAVKIPVIGNGDIKIPEDAKLRIQQTKCDAIMVGRALLGNPWLIQQIKEFILYNDYKKTISIEERFNIIRKHLNNLIESKGKRVGILEIRSHLFWYVKGLKNSIYFKNKIQNIENLEILRDNIEEYYNFLFNEEKINV